MSKATTIFERCHLRDCHGVCGSSDDEVVDAKWWTSPVGGLSTHPYHFYMVELPIRPHSNEGHRAAPPREKTTLLTTMFAVSVFEIHSIMLSIQGTSIFYIIKLR